MIGREATDMKGVGMKTGEAMMTVIIPGTDIIRL